MSMVKICDVCDKNLNVFETNYVIKKRFVDYSFKNIFVSDEINVCNECFSKLRKLVKGAK